MMKVALIANDTTYTYNLRKEIICKLIEEGYEVSVLGETQLFHEELEEMGCDVLDLSVGRHGTNPLKDLQLLHKYVRFLKSIRPDAVISYNIKPNVYGGMACKYLKIPFLPNITGLGTPVENPGKLQKLAILLYKAGVSNAACIFFQNEENYNFFNKHGMISKRSRTNIIPGSGVNLETHPLLPYPDETAIHFLFVARILKEKGIDFYLAAARKYHSATVRFHVCGMCDDEKYLAILNDAQRDGVIVYHGQQKDMSPYFLQCACLLHPSYYPEGMSNVLLEAAASGRPIIAADRAGCREIVDSGETGFIVPIKNEQAVIDAVGSFLDMPWKERKAMGIAGRKKIEREFDRNIVVNEYLKEIQLAISKDNC